MSATENIKAASGFSEKDGLWILRIGVLLCVLTFLLIVWGGHVNTTKSGMAFPDWPTSNASAMMTYAPSQWMWQSDMFWEHGHRLFASVVGLVSTVLVVIAYRATPPNRRPSKAIAAFVGLVFLTVVSALFGLNSMQAGFMEGFMIAMGIAMIAFLVKGAMARGSDRILWLSIAAFASVCLQGAFGGYTVRNNLPDWVSTTHGMLAEIYFMIIIGITYLAYTARRTEQKKETISPSLRRIVSVTWGLTFVQFFLGALTRHTDSWGVSLSFPQWSEASFFPSASTVLVPQVLIHLAHRTLAYFVAAAVLTQAYMVFKSASVRGMLSKTTSIASILVLVQIILGAFILWTSRGELATTLHVMVGVGLLALNTVSLYVSSSSSSVSVAQRSYDSVMLDGKEA